MQATWQILDLIDELGMLDRGSPHFLEKDTTSV